MLFQEVISVYTEKHKETHELKQVLLIIKAGEIYIYH
jgi:hypothetical protein